ncbi:MAG: MgtC/SapB family protein, partial [Vicinamibacterales bacterium]
MPAVPTLSFDLPALWNVAVAALGGLSVGIERQWSGHAQGTRARFAGVRTFTMLGLVAGVAGWLSAAGLVVPAAILLTGLSALIVVAYSSASRADVDGTTEVAAFVVLAAGMVSGLGFPRVGSGLMALTTLLLIEKTRLHAWVRALDRQELRAGARFAVMAAVILPVLPTGPYGPADTIKPRLLWALVLFFSGLSFLGYVAQRV